MSVIHADCVTAMRLFADESVDAVVTDPPYGLSREPDALEVLRHWLAGDDYQHRGAGFMGQSWDSFVPGPAVWREVLRVLKPGGHALVFSGTRTYDLTVLAMRIAGFEIRDQLAWMYGTGFPKSLDVSKAIDKAAGAERTEVLESRHRKATGRMLQGEGGYAFAEDFNVCAPVTPEAEAWSGWGTALKPAHEPICLARKPLTGTVAKNVLAYGTGGINVDGCRIGTDLMKRTASDGTFKSANGSMAGHNTGRVELDPVEGRWPANVLLDEAAAAMLDEQSGLSSSSSRVGKRAGKDAGCLGAFAGQENVRMGHDDSGGASRFFYVAKASKAEREAGLDYMPEVRRTDGRKTEHHVPNLRTTARRNHHPTVKPIALMRYLARLITPPNGIILDPYTGSGTTGIAAVLEGFRFVGCELTPEYVEIARARIAYWSREIRRGSR